MGLEDTGRVDYAITLRGVAAWYDDYKEAPRVRQLTLGPESVGGFLRLSVTFLRRFWDGNPSDETSVTLHLAQLRRVAGGIPSASQKTEHT